MTIQSADYTAFKQLATFQSIDELNLTIRRFLYAHSHELTSATINVLKTISRFSCKVLGVCWAKVSTIAQEVGISDRTVRRAFVTLEQHGIIKRIPTQRKKGGDGHNIYVIQRVVEDIELPVSAPVSADLSEREDTTNTDGTSIQQSKNDTQTVSFKTKHSSRFKESNNVRERVTVSLESLDYTYVPSNVPQVFIDACKPFIGALDIFRMYGVVLSAKRYMKVLDIPMDVIIKAFKESIFAYKLGKIKNSLSAYLFGTLCGMIAIHQRQQVHIPNWLEDDDM